MNTMHTRHEVIVAQDRNYTLFVRLPNAKTITIRHLGKVVNISEIHDQLEIQAGLPCQTYNILSPGGGAPLTNPDDNLRFGQDLRNCAVLRAMLRHPYELLFNAVQNLDVGLDVLYRLVVLGGDVGLEEKQQEDESEEHDGDEKMAGASLKDISKADRSFLLLYMSAHIGNHSVCKLLLRLDPGVPFRVTPYGRTALHAAAANDQPKVVLQLLRAGAELSPRDAFGKTPLEYCKDTGASTCERTLQRKILASNTEEGPDLRAGTERPEQRTSSKRDFKFTKLITFPPSNSTMALNTIGAALTSEPCTYIDSGNCQTSTDSKDDEEIAKTNINPIINDTCSSVVTSGHVARHKSHSRCGTTPEFVAMRKVPLEDQRLVTVEFTPMKRPRESQSAVGRLMVPLRKRTGRHAWAEKLAQAKLDQNAQCYYKTKYHNKDDLIQYRARPATAGPRFRFWKTWLVEKLEQEAIKGKITKEQEERQQASMVAYKRWLSRKTREDETRQKMAESSDDEESDGDNKLTRREQLQETFKKCLEAKRALVVRAARQKLIEEKENTQSTCTEESVNPPASTPPASENYIRANKIWQIKKKRYDAWKAKNGTDVDDEDMVIASGDIEDARIRFLMEGMTYEEWMGMKVRESKLV